MVETESVANHPAMAWAESINRRVRDNVEKQNVNEENQQNEEHRHMKIKNEMKMQKWNENEMKIQQQQQKPPQRFSQAKYHRWEFLTFWFKKMIAEVLLVLPL